VDTERKGADPVKEDRRIVLEQIMQLATHPLGIARARKIAGFILHARALTDDERSAIKTLLRLTAPKKKATGAARSNAKGKA
jgi:hypothetical protein